MNKTDKTKEMSSFILNKFVEIARFASDNQTCLRKSVGCCTVQFRHDYFTMYCMTHNGPSVKGNPCSNVVGNCGCSHTEPRAIIKTIKSDLWMMDRKPVILVCTYSPCTNCANIIIDSEIVNGVVYDILTEHDTRGAEFLVESGIKVLSKSEVEAFMNGTPNCTKNYTGDSIEKALTHDTIEGWILSD